MTNTIPPRDPTPSSANPSSTGPSDIGLTATALPARKDRRGQIMMGIGALVVIVAGVLWFSAASQHPDNPAADPAAVTTDPNAGQGQDTSGTPPPATAPADGSTTTQ